LEQIRGLDKSQYFKQREYTLFESQVSRADIQKVVNTFIKITKKQSKTLTMRITNKVSSIKFSISKIVKQFRKLKRKWYRKLAHYFYTKYEHYSDKHIKINRKIEDVEALDYNVK
jgi:uncharacterized protein YqgV (UPF0045/DUF77 family)